MQIRGLCFFIYPYIRIGMGTRSYQQLPVPGYGLFFDRVTNVYMRPLGVGGVFVLPNPITLTLSSPFFDIGYVLPIGSSAYAFGKCS